MARECWAIDEVRNEIIDFTDRAFQVARERCCFTAYVTVRVAPAALLMPRARWPAWRPMIVTKHHLSVVAASFMRLRTRSLPTSTAVV